MVKDYFGKLWRLWSGPADFFGETQALDKKASFRFAVMTGVFLALELGALEALSGGSKWIVALVTFLLLLGFPLLLVVGATLWVHFMRLCAYLTGESLPAEKTLPVVAYSMAGLVALGLGFGLGKWLALSVFFFQFLGVERALRCTRWMAVVYVGLPFSLAAVLFGFFTLIFKIY